MTGIDMISNEDAQESYLTPGGIKPHPSSPKGFWIRTVVYVVLIAAVLLVVWKIYSDQKAQKLQAASQAAALLSRP
ncbi:MAG: hypothetical protein WCA21_13150, partial [Terracidiphilus sp.]